MTKVVDSGALDEVMLRFFFFQSFDPCISLDFREDAKEGHTLLRKIVFAYCLYHDDGGTDFFIVPPKSKNKEFHTRVLRNTINTKCSRSERDKGALDKKLLLLRIGTLG